jgi:hypothetical protein
MTNPLDPGRPGAGRDHDDATDPGRRRPGRGRDFAHTRDGIRSRSGPVRCLLRQGQTAVGTVRRRRLQLLLGPRRSAEDGDGAQLPGVSTRYQLLEYRCLTQGCGIRELRVVVGTDGPPSCPRGHGPLELKA